VVALTGLAGLVAGAVSMATGEYVSVASQAELAEAEIAREELGIDPDDLPSPWLAAASSFAAFSAGALVPLLPYLLGTSTLLWSVLLALLALFGAGALVSRFTSRGALYSGSRQLLLGGVAAALTYAVGSFVGAGI
jgi:VIT1/CCC1 family predicted Fe2+/Mn2+ transporter